MSEARRKSYNDIAAAKNEEDRAKALARAHGDDDVDQVAAVVHPDDHDAAAAVGDLGLDVVAVHDGDGAVELHHEGPPSGVMCVCVSVCVCVK